MLTAVCDTATLLQAWEAYAARDHTPTHGALLEGALLTSWKALNSNGMQGKPVQTNQVLAPPLN